MVFRMLVLRIESLPFSNVDRPFYTGKKGMMRIKLLTCFVTDFHQSQIDVMHFDMSLTFAICYNLAYSQL